MSLIGSRLMANGVVLPGLHRFNRWMPFPDVSGLAYYYHDRLRMQWDEFRDLPLCWDDPAIYKAIDNYMTTVRLDVPWCPLNIEFIRRINAFIH
jgi:hypothetical protein